MIPYRDYALDVTTAPAAGGYTARVAARRRGKKRGGQAIYFPPLGPQPTAVVAADQAIKWVQAFIDENRSADTQGHDAENGPAVGSIDHNPEALCAVTIKRQK